MARISKAKQIEVQNELEALESFRLAMADLRDPRRQQGQRYSLELVVLVALMASVCGADNAEQMATWGEAHEHWLGGLFTMRHGTPTQDVFLRLFGSLDPKQFGAVLTGWANLLSVRLAALDKHIAIDGKTSRRSFDRKKRKPTAHTVSAFMTQSGLVLATIPTKRKSNEITAIPELLKLFDLSGATITIDAMGTQTKIAEDIIKHGGNYVLAVKNNQPTLHKELIATFAAADEQTTCRGDAQNPKRTEEFVEAGQSHGRNEVRRVEVIRDLSHIGCAPRWTNLAFVARVHRHRTILSTGKVSEELAYFIGSDENATVDDVARLIRQHWSTENRQHWVLDTAFREDEARHRAGNCAQNMSILRRIALNLVNSDPNRKVGVATCRFRACVDRSYMIELLTGSARLIDSSSR